MVRLNRIDGGKAQPGQLRHVLEDLPRERAERGRARELRAIVGEIDPGQNHFQAAVLA